MDHAIVVEKTCDVLEIPMTRLPSWKWWEEVEDKTAIVQRAR